MNLGRILGVVAALLLLAGVAVFFLFRFTYSAENLHALQTAVGVDAATPERHIVPEGFRGWAIVDYGIDGSAPLEDDNGTLVASYPESGHLETASPAGKGESFHHREYFERSGDSLVPLTRFSGVWGEYNMRTMGDQGDLGVAQSSGFFVGTFEEYRATDRPLPGLPELEGLD